MAFAYSARSTIVSPTVKIAVPIDGTGGVSWNLYDGSFTLAKAVTTMSSYAGKYAAWDSDGNVYLTAGNNSSAGVVSKINTTGTVQWTTTITSPTTPIKIESCAVGFGIVFVGGYKTSSPYAIIWMFNARTGAQLGEFSTSAIMGYRSTSAPQNSVSALYVTGTTLLAGCYTTSGSAASSVVAANISGASVNGTFIAWTSGAPTGTAPCAKIIANGGNYYGTFHGPSSSWRVAKFDANGSQAWLTNGAVATAMAYNTGNSRLDTFQQATGTGNAFLNTFNDSTGSATAVGTVFTSSMAVHDMGVWPGGFIIMGQLRSDSLMRLYKTDWNYAISSTSAAISNCDTSRIVASGLSVQISQVRVFVSPLIDA